MNREGEQTRLEAERHDAFVTMMRLRPGSESRMKDFVSFRDAHAKFEEAKRRLTTFFEEQARLASIEALEIKVAGIPEADGPSPEAGMNAMRKAVAQDDLAVLKGQRERGKDGRS